jgi:3-methylcrotonyl-CoA carboxylase alpha subunit
MTNRVLIANRGEIACRIVRACQALGWESVAVYHEVDADSLHVALADRAVALPGKSARDTYGNPAALLDAARQSDCGFVHPGYGFLAENDAFARAVVDAGLIWVGPAADTIQDMGDKARARDLAQAAGVPLLPGSARLLPGAVPDADWVGRTGVPLLVKATAGGGGMAMRVVDRLEDLAGAVAAVQAQAARLFNDPAVLVERYIPRARHIEVQVFGFGDGRAVHLYERDCSVQRRFQKVVEETRAAHVLDATRQAMCDAALALARSRRYAGAGTVEFLYDATAERFYFLEMNTRIQVEHAVTEMAVGLDLVQMQLRLAAGDTMRDLRQEDIPIARHAMEFRLCAEDPAKGFRPSPGKLLRLELPEASKDVRVDCGFRAGDTITPHFDSLIAKIVCAGPTRDAALACARSALAAVDVSGITTNIDLLRQICGHPVFCAGAHTTGFLQAHLAELLPTQAA